VVVLCLLQPDPVKASHISISCRIPEAVYCFSVSGTKTGCLTYFRYTGHLLGLNQPCKEQPLPGM